ncbi:hypothetical protein EI77_02985 [Prosthecobacter fusiformis]|uniref:Uncharacterized protein n=1 Tax=Prosthecobacter fusiformis TaxID=48464 RepID=A0A4R7RUC0_9BACT|nr:hypothetical protein [Prosthecobacter fusiformis]TDU69332.1 hypothetical protein EI77_02985 [Prosthecobacter fusiformis]
MNTDVELAQLLTVSFGLAVAAGAAFFGAWLAFLAQRHAQRVDRHHRLKGLLALSGLESRTQISALETLLTALNKLEDEFKKDGAEITIPTVVSHREALTRIKFELVSLQPETALLPELIQAETHLLTLEKEVQTFEDRVYHYLAEYATYPDLIPNPAKEVTAHIARVRTSLFPARDSVQKVNATSRQLSQAQEYPPNFFSFLS